jgi:hypothetical protein
MKTTFPHFLRPFLFSSLALASVLTSCSNDDEDTVAPVVPSTGQAQLIHVAPYNKVKFDFVVNDKKLMDVDYGKNTGYKTVNTGSATIKVKNSTSQADVLPGFSQSFEKDKSYSVFIYNPTASTLGSLVTTDDLTTPAAGKANIRFVNTGFDAGAITLTAVGSTPFFTNVAYGTAVAFSPIEAKTYSLEARNSLGVTLATKSNVSFSDGKSYTVVLRGRNSPAVPADEALTLDVIQNK